MQGSRCRVQGCGGGFAANIYGAMPEGLRVAGFPRIASLPRVGNAVKLSKILIAHASNSVCFFHALSLPVNNKIKKLVK